MNDTVLLTIGEMWGASFVKRLKVMKKAVYHSFLPVLFVEFSLNLSASAYLSPSIRSPRFSIIFPIVEFHLLVFSFFCDGARRWWSFRQNTRRTRIKPQYSSRKLKFNDVNQARETCLGDGIFFVVET